MKLSVLFPSIALAAILISCEKDPSTKITEPEPPVAHEHGGQVTLDFKPTMNGADLVAETKWYKNDNGDSFTVNKFNYYITNIRFEKEDGSVFAETESYHLIKHLEGKNKFVISNVPTGVYSSVEFLIGVDSLRNISGVQKGDLDINQDMFWDWNQGYIFFKLEGDYITPNTGGATNYGMHVGNYSCIEKCVLPLAGKLKVGEDKTASVYIAARIDSIFNGEVDLDLDTYSTVAIKSGKTVSTNYKSMFAIYKIEN